MADLRPRAWRRWQAAAGPWRGWAVCPALSMPSAIAPTADATLPSVGVECYAKVLQQDGTAVVLDLDPVVGVAIGAELSRRRLAHVVLLLPRWPHSEALLPCDQLVSVLVRTSSTLSSAASRKVVFVLDAERQKPVHKRTGDARIDNRYMLAPGDLPALNVLRRAGIQRVVKIARAA